MALSDTHRRVAEDAARGLADGASVPIRSPQLYIHMTAHMPDLKIDRVTTRGDRFIVWLGLSHVSKAKREETISAFKETLR